MPLTQFKSVVYGAKKDLALSKFNIGSFTKAVTFDLEEFGQRGVQGMKIDGKAVEALVSYWKKALAKDSDAYIMGGVAANGHLYLSIRNKKKADFEEMAIAVKDYAKKREALVKNNAAVVNINTDEDDAVIKPAAAAQADRFKTKVDSEVDADFGDIRGNIVLCAHGTPQAVDGRVIGIELGEMTPEELFKYLVEKGLGKAYNGKITLSGCFTGAGGPEASKADAPFAAKVLERLRAKGYSKASVVAMPGPSITVRKDGEKDTDGKGQKRGDKKVQANVQNADAREVTRKTRKATEDLNKLAVAYNALHKDITDNRPAAEPARTNYNNSEEVKEKKAKLKKLDEAYEKMAEDLKALESDEANKVIANYAGVFGLRDI